MMAQVFLISDYAAAGGADNVTDGAIIVDPEIYIFATLTVGLVGLLVGAVELLFLNRRLASLSLGAKLVSKTLFYMALLSAVMLILYPIAAALEMNTGLMDARVGARLQEFVFSKASLGTGVQLTTSLVLSLFYAEMSEQLGANVLTNFLTGRYHTPKEERRVFLFSDMKSSTGIAEQLGHQRYFSFLRAYYAALEDAIVDHGGEVYQYIGDEVIVSWPEEAGLRDHTCVRCVFRMKEDLRGEAQRFEEEFGVAPDFKAGMQTGAVTTGELGALKKEIVFSGDVLNQAARLQALCGELGTDILLGDELRAGLVGNEGWAFESLGEHVLRGKDRPVEVFTPARNVGN